jgi:hypothetical protein
MTAERSYKIGDIEIKVGQPVFIIQHSGCAGSKGHVIEIVGNDCTVSCNTCRNRNVVLDVPTTLEALEQSEKSKRRDAFGL